MIDEIIIIERDDRTVAKNAPFRPTETTILINEYKGNIQRFGGLAYFGGVANDSNQRFVHE
mgnify:CR=1 FL=1